MKTRTILVLVLILAAVAAYMHATGRIVMPPPHCVGAGAYSPRCNTTTVAR